MRLETNRLALMDAQFTDANDVFMAVKESVAELSPWMPWAQQGYGLRNAQAFIADAVQMGQAKTKFVFLARGRSSGKLMGVFELAHVPDTHGKSVPMYEIGYWMRSSEAGQGYATEAVQKLVDYALSLGARRVFATTASRNEASQKVLSGAGLDLEATLRNNRLLPDGSLDDTVVFAKIT